MIKKYFLGLGFAFISIFMNAQIKNRGIATHTITEEFISKRLAEAKKAGSDATELLQLKEHLYKMLQPKKEAALKRNSNENRQAQPLQTLSGCVNIGFEDGTVNGWVLQSGDASLGSLPCPTCITGSPGSGIYQVVGAGITSTVNSLTPCSCGSTTDCSTKPCNNGVDDFGNFAVTAPAPSGGKCLLINNSECNYLMERASQTFVVDSANNFLTYQFAVVLQSGGHAPNAQPYFHVELMDSTAGSIISCSQYDSSPPTSGGLNGWSLSTIDNTVYYMPWQAITVDMSTIIGHKVTLAFTVSDCNAGGHFGYAYIDASCGSNPNQITLVNPLCLGGGPAILGGPSGMSTYNWTGPVTGNTQNLTTSTPGNYTLAVTSAGGCSGSTLYYNLMQGAFSGVSVSALKDTVACGAIDTLIASGASTYTWSSNAGNSVNDTISVSPNSNTTYVVIGTDSVGCVDTVARSIFIKSFMTIQVAGDTICSGAVDTLIASGATNYVWSSNAGSSTNDTVFVSSYNNITYTVSGTNGGGCSDSATKTIYVKRFISVSVINDTICMGDADTLTASGASSYTWSGNALSATTNTVSVSPTVSTTYTVTGIEAISGCLDTATQIVNVINCTTDINQTMDKSDKIIIYPNPANGILSLDCKCKKAELVIYDVLGNNVMQLQAEKEITNIDVSGLNKGVYFLSVKNLQAATIEKFIIQR